MFCKFLIRPIQFNFFSALSQNTGFQIVALNHLGYAAKIFICVDMCCGPALLIHRKEPFHIAVSAVRKCSNKDVNFDEFSGGSVNNSDCVACPIHLHNLARLMIQMHCCIFLGTEVVVIFVKLSGLIRQFTGKPALIYIFPPENIHRYSITLQFLVHMFVVRHLILYFSRCIREQHLIQLFIRHFLRQRVLKIVFLG